MDWTEWIVHHIFFWEDDDSKKGHMVRAVHHAITYGYVTLVLVSHTIYPAFWLQTILLGMYLLVWCHHILTHGCVVSKVEQRLLKDEGSFIDPYLELFGVEANERSKQGILMLGSTLVATILSLEWLGKAISLLRSHLPAAPPILHTLAMSSYPLE